MWGKHVRNEWNFCIEFYLHKPVNNALFAAVQIIEFRFCYGIIDIHCWHSQFASFRQLIQAVHARYTLFDNSFNQFENGRIFLQHQMCCIAAIIEDHIWLPIFSIHTLIDTPPKVLFRFTTPSKYRESSFGQCGCYFILSQNTEIWFLRLNLHSHSFKRWMKKMYRNVVWLYLCWIYIACSPSHRCTQFNQGFN